MPDMFVFETPMRRQPQSADANVTGSIPRKMVFDGIYGCFRLVGAHLRRTMYQIDAIMADITHADISQRRRIWRYWASLPMTLPRVATPKVARYRSTISPHEKCKESAKVHGGFQCRFASTE